MFCLIVVSIRFAVSSLNGFTISIECFTVPPMSVVSNKIWTNCFVPIIRFLVILFSRRVDVNHLDYSSRFSRQVPKQVMNSFDVPTLFVLLEFCSIVLLCSIVLISSIFDCIHTIICLILFVRNIMIFLKIFLNLVFFSCWITLSPSTVMFTTFLKYAVLCYRYSARSFLPL